MPTEKKRKLIEVALPLKVINEESAREKSIRHGHPSTLHLWWARRPLAACRAVLFASLVDDPSSHPEFFPTEEEQETERQRLFDIIEELVKWENTNNDQVLGRAREEIMKATDGNPPPVLDPFCGGGSIPLEAQRLGLEAHASDLNPVAVLITKALVEIPPKFANKPPVNPKSNEGRLQRDGSWRGAQGLAEDIRYYGQWMRDEAEKRIGNFYPKVKLPEEKGGGETTVIAWLWARTVKCPNPACGAQMPLIRSFWLSKKKGKQTWVEPVIDQAAKSVKFVVKTGEYAPRDGTKQRGHSECIFCGLNNISDATLRDRARTFGIGEIPIAVVAEGQRSRVYLGSEVFEEIKLKAPDAEWLDQSLPDNARWFSPPGYGLETYKTLFTPRQLVTLTTFSDLVGEARQKVLADAVAAGLPDDGIPLNSAGRGARAYSDAMALLLSFANDKGANYWSTICAWHSGRDIIVSTFGRQALPMVWDYAEANPFSNSSGNFLSGINQISAMIENCPPAEQHGVCKQLDATTAIDGVDLPLICTDPPYYDNIGYADLSDFFYIWLRKSIKDIFPDIFSTLLVPKDQELVATPYRFGGDKKAAELFFERGLASSFQKMRAEHHADFPLILFYAFKQAEKKPLITNTNEFTQALVSTGWETMLASLIESGFSITGTWPVRTELIGNLKKNVGALASSVVLVCRPRPVDAPIATRREYISALKADLPDALKKLQHGNIAPVDLAQAAIGPGMAVFSRYSKVVEADGNPMRVRTALALINQILDEVLAAEEGEYDPDTRWAIAWFEQHGLKDGPYGEAETLSKAKNVGVESLAADGFVKVGGGKVRLLKKDELAADWEPAEDTRLTVWETAHYLVRALEEQGEMGAAKLLKKIGYLGETSRDLAYRLYTICDKNKWANEAFSYNSLVVAWPEIARIAQQEPETEAQTSMEV